MVTLPRAQPGPAVVVCEDDDPTLELLCDHLEADRFCALPAPSAADALRLCHYNHPDLLLLDLNLPDASGLEVLREIRGTDGATGGYDPELPVIVISGRGAEADRIRGLDVRRRRLRRQAVRDRRGRGPHPDRPPPPRRPARRAAAGGRDLRSIPRGARSRCAVSPVKLANKEFSLLRTLAAEPNRVFTKDELLRDVWGFRSMGRTRTLDSHASRLRRKLDPESGRYVVNCWGVGYRLIDAPPAADAGFDR